jgi:hypothetical protein
MPVLVTRSEVPGVWSSVELIVAGDGTSQRLPVDLIVAEGADFLLVTLTGEGPTGFLHAPTQAEFTIVDPQGTSHNELIVRAPNGQLTLAIEKPTVGRWTVMLFYGERASAEMSASVLASELPSKLARFGGWVRCKSCKLGLKVAIVACSPT